MRIKHKLAKLELMIGNIQDGIALYESAGSIAKEEKAEELITILAGQASALARANELEVANTIANNAKCKAREAGNEAGLLSALETLSDIAGKRGQAEAALAYQEKAMVLAERLGNENLLATCLRGHGWRLKEVGRYEDALTVLERSLAIQKAGTPNYSLLAVTHNALADTYISTEDYGEARKNMVLAVEYWQRFDRSADVAVGLGNLANLANREGLFEEALDYARQAYDVDLISLGEGHPDLAFSLTCIGESLIGMREFDSAIEPLQTAFALRTTHETPAGNIAWSGWLLGRALVDSNTDPAAGIQHVEAARAVFASMGAAAESELHDVDNWLSARLDPE